eukprot:TRINITY_DN28570_c4_g1_i1.p1 TRINITY_DN28570_c4_g1~~TRINITY_DN28570_c4_g1_i1.p1  ORF type:complete len:267 (+),score=59.45 TRINITY_DN28570_c4_g1_i1:57-857(+)
MAVRMRNFQMRFSSLSVRSFEPDCRSVLRPARSSLSLQLSEVSEQKRSRSSDLGTIAAMASKERYARLLASLHDVYVALEEELDSNAEQSPILRQFWSRHGDALRRAPALKADLEDVADFSALAAAKRSSPTLQYISRVRAAASEDRGARLLAHLYCRHLSDLVRAERWSGVARAALRLESEAPRLYSFQLPGSKESGGYLEQLNEDFDEAGLMLSREQFSNTVAEFRLAVALNAGMYHEEPLFPDAIRGGLNVCAGLLVHTAPRT